MKQQWHHPSSYFKTHVTPFNTDFFQWPAYVANELLNHWMFHDISAYCMGSPYDFAHFCGISPNFQLQAAGGTRLQYLQELNAPDLVEAADGWVQGRAAHRIHFVESPIHNVWPWHRMAHLFFRISESFCPIFPFVREYLFAISYLAPLQVFEPSRLKICGLTQLLRWTEPRSTIYLSAT